MHAFGIWLAWVWPLVVARTISYMKIPIFVFVYS
jgi:hypothetical protein